MKKAFKLHKGHFRVGVPLSWDVYDETNQLLLRRGYVIEKEEQLESLLARGIYIEEADFEASIAKAHVVQQYDPFWLWDDLTAKTNHHLAYPDRSNEFSRRTEYLAGKVQELVRNSPDVVIAIIMLNLDHRRYAAVHSLHVAALCDLLANRLGWEKEHRLSLVCAALTMNIGMFELQQQLTNQRTPLTPEQSSLIREHPLKGALILRNLGVTDANWLSTVEKHHETASGTGYPQGLKELAEEAMLLRTLDVYCAKISPRMYRKPITGPQAERLLFSDQEIANANPFIPALIREIGVYPPGTFVKLVNEEVAIVHKRSSNIKTPQVLSLTNSKGEPMLEPVQRDTSREGYSVRSEVPRDSILININPSKYWQDHKKTSDRKQWG